MPDCINKNITFSEGMYLLSISILLIIKSLGFFDGQLVFKVGAIFSLSLILIKFLTEKHDSYQWCYFFLLMGIFCACYYFTGEKGLIINALLFFGANGIKKSDAVKISVISIMIPSCMMILASLLGLFQDHYHWSVKFRNQGFIIRRDFGIINPNVMHTLFFLFVLLILYLNIQKTIKEKIFLCISMMSINLLFFLFTVSFTGMLSVVVALSLFLVIDFYPIDKFSYLEIWGYVVFFSIIVGSIVLPLILRGKAFSIVDKIMHNRMSYANYFLLNEKITLFGSRFQIAPDPNYYIDNAFLYLFLHLGVVPFLCVISMMSWYLHYVFKKHKKEELVLFLSCCFIGMSDPFLFNASCKSFIFVTMGVTFYENARTRKGIYFERESGEHRISNLFNHIENVIRKSIRFFYSFVDKVHLSCRNNYKDLLWQLLISIGMGALFVACPQMYSVSLLSKQDYTIYKVYENIMVEDLFVWKNIMIFRSGCMVGAIWGIFVKLYEIINILFRRERYRR